MRICLIIAFILVACEGKKPDNKEKNNAKEEGMVQNFDSKGRLLNEMTMKDGKKNGLSRSYYPNGKVNLEINYQNNIKQGISKRYYESGKLYQQSEYIDGELNGIQKKLGEDGKLLSEGRYQNGEPCMGLKEYKDDGSIKSYYPSIVIKPINHLLTEGAYILKVSLTDEYKRVSFFRGSLSKDGCMNSRLVPLTMDKQKGEGEVRYFLAPGDYRMEEVNIVAEIRTVLGNSYITQRSYNLAIDNK